MRDFEDFQKGRVAIICADKAEVREFLTILGDRGYFWTSGDYPINFERFVDEFTALVAVNSDTLAHINLTFGHSGFDYELVSYSELTIH